MYLGNGRRVARGDLTSCSMAKVAAMGLTELRLIP